MLVYQRVSHTNLHFFYGICPVPSLITRGYPTFDALKRQKKTSPSHDNGPDSLWYSHRNPHISWLKPWENRLRFSQKIQCLVARARLQGSASWWPRRSGKSRQFSVRTSGCARKICGNTEITHGNNYNAGYIMGIPWEYSGVIMGIPWEYSGVIMGIPWEYSGVIMGIPWEYSGVIMGIQWEYSGVIMGIQWEYSGVVMGIPWEYSGVIMGIPWEYSGVIMGIPWEYSGVQL